MAKTRIFFGVALLVSLVSAGERQIGVREKRQGSSLGLLGMDSNQDTGLSYGGGDDLQGTDSYSLDEGPSDYNEEEGGGSLALSALTSLIPGALSALLKGSIGGSGSAGGEGLEDRLLSLIPKDKLWSALYGKKELLTNLKKDKLQLIPSKLKLLKALIKTKLRKKLDKFHQRRRLRYRGRSRYQTNLQFAGQFGRQLPSQPPVYSISGEYQLPSHSKFFNFGISKSPVSPSSPPVDFFSTSSPISDLYGIPHEVPETPGVINSLIPDTSYGVPDKPVPVPQTPGFDQNLPGYPEGEFVEEESTTKPYPEGISQGENQYQPQNPSSALYPYPPAQFQNPAAQNPDPSTQYLDPAGQSDQPDAPAQFPYPAAQNPDPAEPVSKPAAQNPDPLTQYLDPAGQSDQPDAPAQFPYPAAQNPDPAALVSKPAAPLSKTSAQSPNTAAQLPHPNPVDPMTSYSLQNYAYPRTSYSYLHTSYSYQPSSYSHQPSSYSHQPSSYSYQPSSYSHQPSSYSHQPSSYSHQPSSYSHQPSSYSYQPSGPVEFDTATASSGFMYNKSNVKINIKKTKTSIAKSHLQ